MKIGLVNVDGHVGKKNGEVRLTLTLHSGRLHDIGRIKAQKWNGHCL